MTDDLKQAADGEEPMVDELDSAEATWTWARTAGVSREELLRALELARRDRSTSAAAQHSAAVRA